jgi:hypothetical protein
MLGRSKNFLNLAVPHFVIALRLVCRLDVNQESGTFIRTVVFLYELREIRGITANKKRI